MRKQTAIVACVTAFLGFHSLSAAALETQETYGIGRPPTADEVKAWDITVMPDGTGLPPGSGTISRGAAVYREKCASCHGSTASEGPFETLVGTESLADQIKKGKRPNRTIGNMWFSAPVLFDYIRRAMPFNDPGSLTTEDVYGLTGWLLYRNGLIKDDRAVDARILSGVKMPAFQIFVEDPRRPWLVR
jgi:cytochrome c